MKTKLVSLLLAVLLFVSLSVTVFASARPDESEAYTILSDEAVRPDANWRYTAKTADGEELTVLQAVYHGQETIVYADGYDGADKLEVECTEAEESTGGGFPMMFGSSEASGGFSFNLSLLFGDDFDPMGINSGDPDPAIVEQFEKIELENFVCPNDYGESEDAPFVCYIYVPEEAVSQSLPIVFCLNGVGECGTNGSNLTANRMATAWIDPAWQAEHPCIVVAPQAPVHLLNAQSENPHDPVYPELMSMYVERLKPLFDEMIEEYEPSAVYLTGVSMGSITSLMFLSEYPEYPIDAVLLCCGAAYSSNASKIPDIPIMFASDANDGTVDPADVCDTYNTLMDKGNTDVTLVISYMNYGHFIWEYVYDNPYFMDWLFVQ